MSAPIQPARLSGIAISSLILVLFLGQHLAAPTQDNTIQQQQKQPLSDQQLLVAKLLRLTAPTTGEQQQQQQKQANSELSQHDWDELLGDMVSKKKKQQLVMKPAEQADGKKALKRKLEKLVDEMLEAGGAGDEKFAVDKPQARRRKLLGQPNEQRERDADQAEGKRPQMILIKRKPQLAELGISSPSLDSNALSNELAALAGASQVQQQQQQQQQRRPPAGVNGAEHERRILDDAFGILRDSKFTTNNHLGTKGVPKFGSDEQF